MNLDCDSAVPRVGTDELGFLAAGNSHSTGRLCCKGFNLTLASFRPRETERIAGIPHHLQRLWRHRGHLVERPRYAPATYSSAELAELCVRYRLSTCSVPPALSGELGRQASSIVLLAGLSLTDGAVQVVGPDNAVGEIMREFSANPGFVASLCEIKWESAHRHLWSVDGSEFRLGAISDAELLASRPDLIMVIDLVAMGARIARMANGPLAILDCRAESSGRFVTMPTSRLEVTPNWQ
jgi:hypothetical protein